jgi:hypothetical protein
MKINIKVARKPVNFLKLKLLILILLISGLGCIGQDTIRIPVLPAGKAVQITFEVQINGALLGPSDTVISSQVLVRADSIEDTYSYDPEFNFIDTSFATITYIKSESNPTDLEEKDNFNVTEFNFNVYPNPNNGIFTLSFEQATPAKHLQLSIYNMLGVELFREKLMNFSGKYRRQFTETNFTQGIYFIRVTVDGIIFRKTLVIKP